MNALGIALVWCMVQVTVVALLSGGLYFALRRFWPAAGAAVVLTSLAVVLGLTLLIVSPWPQWHLSAAATPETNLAATPVAASSVRTETADTAAKPDTAVEAAPAGPSAWSVLWRTTLAELSTPPAAATETSWHWPAFLACLVALGVAVQLVWFVAGALAVRSYRAKSRPVSDAELGELLDVLRAELSCVRPIELREADGLATAATLGWRRPLVLVPADWRQWSPAQRRAILAHEVAHVRSSDFLAVVLGQLSVAVHFYHPLVHWLLQRLRLEQELAADALAASVSGGQRSYLAAIAELALRTQDRPLLWPARSFLPTRNTLLRRIAMLRDSKLRFARLSPAVRGLTVGAVLMCGLAAVGLRGPAGGSTALAQAPALQPAAALSEATDGTIDLRYVPEDAQGFLVFRPAAIARSPQAVALFCIAAGVPLSSVSRDSYMADTDQTTIAFLSVSGVKEAFSTRFERLVIDHGKKPLKGKFDENLQHSPPEAKVSTKSVDGKSYYLLEYPSPLGPQAAFFPDECTSISGPEAAVRQVITSPSPGLPKLVRQEAIWKELEKDQIVLVANQAGLGQVLRNLPPNWQSVDRIASVLPPVAPLYQASQTLFLGLRADTEVRFHGQAASKDEAGAKQVETAVDALRVLVLELLKAIRPTPNQPMVPNPQILQFIDRLETAVRSGTVQRQGEAVQVSLAIDLKGIDLDPLVKMLSSVDLAKKQMEAANKLKLIALAMHNYLDVYKHFPPAILYGPDGKTPYSWRVALLPFLNQAELYKQYRQDEPWDSPNNRQVLEKMPDVYRWPSEPADSTRSCFFVFTGPAAIFDGGKAPRIEEIRDGCSNTLLVVEAKRDIPWTKPEDISYDVVQPLPELGGYRENGFWVALADGSARLIPKSTPEATLRALITKAGGERFEMPK